MRDNMDATTLQIPNGVFHSQYVDGMREISTYFIDKDTFCVRWDTVINGMQYGIKKYIPDGYGSIAYFCDCERDDSRRLLLELSKTNVEIETQIKRAPGNFNAC